MTTSEEPGMAGSGAEQQLKAATKPDTAPRKPRVAPSKPKSRKKTTPAKKPSKAPKKATSAKPKGARKGSKTAKTLDLLKRRGGAKPRRKSGNARPGSKAAKILDLLKRPGGATLKELRKATSWQPHSIRGFLSLLGKKKGLAVESTKSPDGERTYSVKA